MKILLILLTLLVTLYAEKTIHIGKHTFILIEEAYNEYGDKGMTMMLYAEDANRSDLPQFRFVLRYQSGSCNVKNLEDGHYRFEKDSIFTYSHWERFNNDSAPIGDRIQVCKVDENGSFYVSDSKVYIEKTTMNDDADEGMKYLYIEATTEDEKLLLDEYMSSVESIFKAKFVMGKEAKSLNYEVNKALQDKYKTQWN